MNFHLHLDTERVERLHVDDPLSVNPDVTIRHVVDRLKESQKSCILVCEQDKLVGIFTERNALQLMAAGADLESPIRTVMTANPVTASRDDSVATAINKMTEGGYRRLPVLDPEGRAIGILTVPHILHYLVEHFPEVVYNLPPTPHHTTKAREGA